MAGTGAVRIAKLVLRLLHCIKIRLNVADDPTLIVCGVLRK